MTKIRDIIKLKKDIVFGGAVQTEWFYEDKSKLISENFVFHGPDFFGVTEDDIEFKSHKLMDTCTYTELISEKLSSEEGNPIMLTIAGYGTGKSHLSVTLGTLFSQEKSNPVSKKILSNIRGINSEIANNIESKLDKPNLVIVLNGMRDFNLNYEIINCAKKSLQKWGYDEEIFSEFTKAYNIAFRFLDKNYERFESQFFEAAKKRGIITNDLFEYLKSNIYQDSVFDCINDVYKEFAGEYIRWDEGISASEVLTKLSERLCNERGQFNKILILFDEFGRYIEYASEYPNRAGDSALQQLFEAIQDSNNKIIFNAFIQSDLKTYLSRVNKTANISRYIGRYEAGDKIYLSSNLETIFANLIDKYDKELFEHSITGYFNRDNVDSYNRKVFDSLNKWIEGVSKRGIWSNYDKYKNVILQGIYPLNPIATWLITYLSDWYQQRSALNFLIRSFEEIEAKEIHELGDLPEIKATDIIKGDLFEELLLAETEGRQKSEYCTLFDKIQIKYKDKLKPIEQEVLSAVLVLKLCKFKNKDKEDVQFAIEAITGLKKEIIKTVISDLEDIYGIIGYDERNHTYDFIEDATGKNDFLRMLRKKKNNFKIDEDSLFNAEIIEKLGVEKILDTDFSKRNYIKSNEWKYVSSIITTNSITELDLLNMVKDFKESTSPEKPKGKLIYLYNNKDSDSNNISRIANMYKKLSIDRYPIIFVFLDDKENALYEALVNDRICRTFTQEENIKFSKYIARFINETNETLKDVFRKLILERLFLTANGVESKELRLQAACNNKFNELYPKAIPFDFTGFDNKSIAIPKKIHISLSKLIVQNALNYQTISTQSADVVNRVKSVLENQRSGWGVLSIKSNNVSIISPMNQKVRFLFDKLDDKFYNTGEILFSDIIKEFTAPPYGLNDYSVALLINVYIASKYYEAKLCLDNKIINNIEWANEVYTDKIINYSNLTKSKIIKINIEGYKLAFQNLCAKIDSNRDVDACIQLNNELKNLLLESEAPEEFKEKVEGCKLILEEGIRLYKKVNDTIGRLEGKLEKAVENSDFKDIISLIDETEELNTQVEDNSRFVYSEKYEMKFVNINKKARYIVENKFDSFLMKECRCRVIEQASKFESWMEYMSRTLQRVGYSELSMKTRTKLRDELDNLQLIRERQNVEQNIELFLDKKITQFLTQEELMSLDKEGKTLLVNLQENNKLRNTDKAQFEKRIKLKLDNINNLLNEIKDKLTEIYDSIDEIASIEDVKNIKSKIDYILGKKLRTEDKEDIEEIGNCIQNFINDTDDIKLEQDIMLRMELANQVKIKYTDNDYVNLDEAIEDYIDILKDSITERSKIWSSKYLNYTSGEISVWDSNKCYSWFDITNVIPNYLQPEEIKKYNFIKEMVIERTKQIKLESILVMFNQLSVEEKEVCITLLSKNIK